MFNANVIKIKNQLNIHCSFIIVLNYCANERFDKCYTVSCASTATLCAALCKILWRLTVQPHFNMLAIFAALVGFWVGLSTLVTKHQPAWVRANLDRVHATVFMDGSTWKVELMHKALISIFLLGLLFVLMGILVNALTKLSECKTKEL